METIVAVIAMILTFWFAGTMFYKFTQEVDAIKRPNCRMMQEYMYHTIDRLKYYFNSRFEELEDLWRKKKSSKK